MVLHRVHAIAALAFVAAIVVQVVLAGLAISNLGGSGDFRAHAEFGYTWVGFAGLAVVVTALLARRTRRDIGVTILLLVQYIVQTLLPAAKGSMPFLAALHPLNAMLLFGFATWYAVRASRAAFPRDASPAPTEAPAASASVEA